MEELTAHARHEFELSAPHKGGGTLRSHLTSIQRQRGKTPAGLISPPRPPGSDMLWRMFHELSMSRHWSDWGVPMPISYAEIEAWMRVNKYRVSINDLALLRMLDAEYRSIMSAAIAKQKSKDDDDDWSAN